MKYWMAALASFAAICLLTGCGEDEKSTPISQQSQVFQNSGSSGISSENNPSEPVLTDDISYAAMLPDPSAIFPNGKITIIDDDGGSAYTFQVTEYSDGEYEQFRDACKKMGFSDIQFDIVTDTNNKFEARSEDGKYYVSLQLLKDERAVLNVTCAKRRNAD